MAIKKQYLKNKAVCKVTFTVLATVAKRVAVVGDFNNWNPKDSSLKRLKNGTFRGSFELPKEKTYEFRYLVDDTYINDMEADGFRWNDYAGAENTILKV